MNNGNPIQIWCGYSDHLNMYSNIVQHVLVNDYIMKMSSKQYDHFATLCFVLPLFRRLLQKKTEK